MSLSPDQAGRLRKAVDRVEDQARRARRPAAEAEIEDYLASIQAMGQDTRTHKIGTQNEFSVGEVTAH